MEHFASDTKITLNADCQECLILPNTSNAFIPSEIIPSLDHYKCVQIFMYTDAHSHIYVVTDIFPV